MPRAFLHDVCHDLAGPQASHALLASRQPGQERRSLPQVPVRRAGRQAALGEQVVPVPGEQPSGRLARRAAVPGLLMLVVLGWAWLQSTPLTPPDWHNPAWKIIGRAFGVGGQSAISLNPFASQTEVM